MTDNAIDVADVKVFLPPRDTIVPAFEQNNVPVFLGCDDNFFAPAMTTVASLLRHMSPDRNYDINIVQSGVSKEKMARALSWVGAYPNASIRFIDISVLLAMADSDRFRTTRYLSVAAYFRIFAPRMFVRYDKMLYLDSDLVILADIADLYDTDLGGNLIAACHDLPAECQALKDPELAAFWQGELGKKPGDSYFNSGVMVMNLEGMRRANTQAAVLAKVDVVKSAKLADQDILNAVLKDEVVYLDPQWNCFDWMHDKQEESQNFGYISPDSLEAIRRSRDTAKIIHYTEKKPWAGDYMGKNEGVFWDNAAKTPFHSELAAKLAAQLSLSSAFQVYLRLSFEMAHFFARGALIRPTERCKYKARIANLRLRRRGLVRQFWRIRMGRPEE